MIIAEDRVFGSSPDFAKKYILKKLDFIGGNEHIKNPLNDPIEYCIQDREVPLTGEEEVYGDYLLYDCCGHDGTELIFCHDSLEELEKQMLGGAGIFNPFTTTMIAIVHGRVKHYKHNGSPESFRWVD
jgi:hypothetical protein